MAFMAKNHRRPSKYKPEERNALNGLRHIQGQFRADELKPDRVEM